MPSFTQCDRPLSINTPLGQDVLLLTAFQGAEAISEPFRFQLDLLADTGSTIHFGDVVGQKVTVKFQIGGGEARYFDGIVSRLSQGSRDANFVRFRAEMVPQFWLLTKKVRSRIFQHLSVPDILHAVLADLDVSYELTGTYFPRDYCAQYRESDFNFASRLMEEEGIHYFFQHSESSHRLIVSDSSKRHPAVPGQSRITYDEHAEGVREDQRIWHWEKTQELRAGVYTLWDHSFELPGRNLEAKEKSISNVTVGKATHSFQVGSNDQLEIYDYPGGYAQRFDGVGRSGGAQPQDLKHIFKDGERTVRIRMEQEEAEGLHIEGASDCPQFAPGCKFSLEGHFDADDDYLLMRVEHTARLGEGSYRSDGSASEFQYENRFTCLPVALPYRPRRVTPKPAIGSVQTATVVGPAGEEVYCDKYGRVKVQFHWDREGKKNADSSCWLRVAQVWAGKQWGAFFWPRIGHEVVVAFEDGDPDQPIIVGSVYNAENMPPFDMPRKVLLAGIKSASVRGKAFENYNGIVFTDEKGHEHLAIHSERHMTFNSELDKSFHSGRHKHEAVSNMSTLVVGSLPGGGSGGGGPDGFNPMAHTPPAGVPGVNSIMVYGENLQVAVGINNQLAIGSNLQICVNPAAIASSLGLETPQLISGLVGSGVGGNMQLTLGSSANIVLGESFTVNLGKQNFKPNPAEHHAGTEILCGILGALMLLWVVLYGMAKAEDARVSMVVVFQAFLSVLLMTLMTIEETYARTKEAWDVALGNLFVNKTPDTAASKSGIADAVLGVTELMVVLGLLAAPAIIAAQTETSTSS
jgi:type VI secretion system secreted protein VgrG